MDRQVGHVRFARRDLLAIEAVVYIAYNARVRPVRASALAERQDIPARYLEHTLQQLARGGILKGVRGPRGGYVLARERRRVTVGEVLRVLRERGAQPDRPETECGLRFGQVALASLWSEVARCVDQRLDSVTMEDLCEQVREAGIPPEEAGVQDFTI